MSTFSAENEEHVEVVPEILSAAETEFKRLLEKLKAQADEAKKGSDGPSAATDV